ncbi:hypothetical protein AbraIFM66950_011815 [Aspergillus brasiliensis]|nr:hypothetical protein AbraIFM66950_011815 [Aspergillus brasiliensis]
MSLLRYYNKGFGEAALKSHAYNQAVRVGDTIHLSGQGGWKQEEPFEIYTDINAQIDQAFANVDFQLRNAGGQGWSQVYKVRSYHISLVDEVQDAMVRNFRKWMVNHKALWTCMQVGRLGSDDMRVEIEVEAYDPEGAKEATS